MLKVIEYDVHSLLLTTSFYKLFECPSYMICCQFHFFAGEQKADGTISLIKSAHSTILFDTGLPKDREFILTGLKACVLNIVILWLLFSQTKPPGM